MAIFKVLLLNERGDPPFLFQNLRSLDKQPIGKVSVTKNSVQILFQRNYLMVTVNQISLFVMKKH